MELRWSQEAAGDLESIADYLLKHNPKRAPDLVRKIHSAPAELLSFPNRGRDRKETWDTRARAFAAADILIYRVTPEVIHIVRTLQGEQKWPLAELQPPPAPIQ